MQNGVFELNRAYHIYRKRYLSIIIYTFDTNPKIEKNDYDYDGITIIYDIL